MTSKTRRAIEARFGVSIIRMAMSHTWCVAPSKRGEFRGAGRVAFVSRDACEVEPWLVQNGAALRQEWAAQRARFLATLAVAS